MHMKYCHFWGKKIHDLYWLWSTYFWCALFFLVGIVIFGAAIWSVVDKYPYPYLIVFVFGVCAMCYSIYSWSLRIEKYSVNAKGIQLQNVFYKKFYDWREI